MQFAGVAPWRMGDVVAGIDEAARARIAARADVEEEGCRTCAVAGRCNHTCGCLNWQATGDLGRVSAVLCRHERMLMPIADHVGEVLYAERDPHFLHKHYDELFPVLSLIEDCRQPGRRRGR